MDAEEIASWAARHDLPAMFQSREDVVLGGLMSFGARQPDAWRQAGVHTGGILKGGIAAQTPIVATTTTELVLGRAAARAIGLTWPPGLLAAADEVIE
jgi:putative ABC transport system substrate-binding protein